MLKASDVGPMKAISSGCAPTSSFVADSRAARWSLGNQVSWSSCAAMKL